VLYTNFTFQDFSHGTEDSRLWYDHMPGDIRIRDIPDSPSLSACISSLTTNPSSITPTELDVLAAHLANGHTDAVQKEIWLRCSEQASRLFSQHLTANGSRTIRMRAQRLHYYILTLMAEKTPIRGDLVESETLLDVTKPWDYMPHPTGVWWLSCDKENVHWRGPDGADRHDTLGLPTQLDPLDDAWICIGSIYSQGCTISNGITHQHIPHDAPLVLVWRDASGALYGIDHCAAIWRLDPREQIARLPCTQVHFARINGGKLYALDNGQFGAICIYDIATHNVKIQSTLPVWVANDIAFTPSHFYLIDKQQGYIFKFNRQWEFEEKILAFGRGYGRLLDPVSIRFIDGNRLQVISWLNGKLTILSVF
ncbi:MAG: hypothetical protein ACK5X3_19315, partial [Pseudomonadota bacterium]